MIFKSSSDHKQFNIQEKTFVYVQNHVKIKKYIFMNFEFKVLKKYFKNVMKVCFYYDHKCKIKNNKIMKKIISSKLIKCKMKCNFIFFTALNV